MLEREVSFRMQNSPWGLEQKGMRGKLWEVCPVSTKQVKLREGDSKSTEEEKQKQVRKKQKKDSEELKKTSLVLVLQLPRAQTQASRGRPSVRTETGQESRSGGSGTEAGRGEARGLADWGRGWGMACRGNLGHHWPVPDQFLSEPQFPHL